GEGSGTPTEPHHTPTPEATPSPQHELSSSSLPPSLVLPPVADEPASPLGDDNQGEAFPTDSGFEADLDRANIAKTSTLPSDSTPRVTSLAADEGSMQQKHDELMALCTSLQRQQSEMFFKFALQELEINRSLDEGEEAAKRVSDDTEEMATVLTSMDVASILTSGGVQVVPTAAEVATAIVSIPTGRGVVSTASPIIPTAALIFTTATESTAYTRRKGKEKMVESDTPKKKKLQEQIDVQVARELEEQMAREDQRMRNETVVKYLQEYEQIPEDLSIRERIELISDLTSEEVPEEVKSSEEVPKEKVKEMMQLVLVEEFWSTARIETTKEGTKILATVDGKLRTVSKSSIRRNLKLNDEAGINSLPDAELFENLQLMGYNILPNQNLQRQQSEMFFKFALQELEINRLKAKIKLLEDKDRGVAEHSGDDAPIKGRSLDEGEEAAKRVSDDTEKMATVLTSMDLASILTSGGVQVVPTAAEVATTTVSIPTGRGVVSTASPIIPTAALIFTTATESTAYTRRKGKEKMVESDTPKKKKLQEQIDVQDSSEEKLQMMINSLDRSNETVVKYLQEYEQIPEDLSIRERIELISDLIEDFIPIGSKEEAKRFKRKGLRLEQESVKKFKTSEEVPEEVKSSEEVPKEKVKEMMQLVLVEEIFVEALQVKHPIIDWKVHTEGQRSYWKIKRWMPFLSLREQHQFLRFDHETYTNDIKNAYMEKHQKFFHREIALVESLNFKASLEVALGTLVWEVDEMIQMVHRWSNGNSHYGYECSQRVPLVYELEPCYIQNFNDNDYSHDLPCVNPLIDHHCCYKCGNSLNDFFFYQCTCEFCGNGAHVGYNCPAQVPSFQTLPSFPQQYPCCEDCGVLPEADHCQPQQYTVNHPIFNAHNDFFNSQNELTIAQNKLMEQMTSLTSLCEMACQIPACCDDDDDYNSAITPNEPADSLSMGDEHLNTILATESNEFIKSYVENLVPNPSEPEVENGCDVPASFTTLSNVLFDDDYKFDSVDDQSLSDEYFPKEIFSNPLFEEEIISTKIDPHHYNAVSDLIESMLNHDSSIISSSSKIDSFLDEFAGELTLLKSIPLGIDKTDCYPKEDIHLIERLLYDNSSPRPPKEFISKKSNANIESFSTSPILVEGSDSRMEEIDLSFNPDDPMPPGIEDDDYDSERDILIHEELLDNYSFSLPENESFHFDIPLFSRPPAKPPDGNTGTLNIIMMGDKFEQKLSAKCPMMIHGKNIPILDVPLFYFYSLDQFKYGRNWVKLSYLKQALRRRHPMLIRSGPNWLFDIDALTTSMNYKPVVTGNQSNGNAGTKACNDVDNVNTTNNVNVAGTNRVNAVGANTNNELPFDPEMPSLKDISTFNFLSDHEDDDKEAFMNNMDTTIQVSHVATTRIHKDHPIDQDLKIDFPDKVYKFKIALYGLHQAARAWYETVSTYLLDNGLHRGKIDKTLFIRRHKDDILLAQVYVDDIIFVQLRKSYQDGIFISQDKYVAEIIKTYGFLEVKNASTPIETQKPMLKDEDSEEVDVHMYRLMIGSLMYLTSLRPDIMFIVCACARY
nr:hypothetical protein [Tanacetum cinerariifolium]